MLAAVVLAGGWTPARCGTSDEKSAVAADEVFWDLGKNGSPGCALGVFRDGRILYSKGYGLANIEENVPITPQTVFDIGSTSKQFTATSILLLERQGKLSLDDDVRKYIPELPDYGKKITVLQLMNHTSGLRDYLALMELAGYHTDSVSTDGDALRIIIRQKGLNFDPGTEWLYSNTGFFLLSVIVKRVSGKSLKDFAAENVFTPLRMTHTQYRDDHTALIPNRALAYEPKDGGDGYTLDVSYFEQTGDGAVHTTVEDLQKWDENLYSGQVGGKDLVAKLQEQAKLNNGKVLTYAKGLVISTYRGLPTVSHGGAWGGYRAELLRFPRQHFSVACLCNVGNAAPTKRARQVADVYLGSLMEPKSNEKSAEDEPALKPKKEIRLSKDQLVPYTGTYWSDELLVSYVLTVEEDRLVLHPKTMPVMTLRATAKDRFSAVGRDIQLSFTRDAAGAIDGFTVEADRTRGMIFTRKSGPRK